MAVLPVVLNHAGVRGFWGGFVGVDIFFVISGFLITSILVKDIEAGRYTISGFYRRRVLRIFPALFALLAAVVVCSCLTMLPSELDRLGRSVAATALFGSNFLFQSEAGYFAPAARLKPLLHTWSLAIEEQFYIVWPILLALMGKGRPRMRLAVTGAITLISLVLSISMTQSDPESAYYLPQARAWELSLGALLALRPLPTLPRWLAEILAITGIVLIGYAIHFYTEATPFPGIAALGPCLGAFLLLLTGQQTTWVATLLSCGPMVFVGRISYSLYLWHWPVIVLAGTGLFLPPTPMVKVGEIVVALVLAVLSWHFVERPFREGSARWTTALVLRAAAGAIVTAIAIGAMLSLSGGLPQRFNAEQQRIAKYQAMDGDALYRRGTCFVVGNRASYDSARCLHAKGRLPQLLLAGDSHAAQYWPGLARYDGNRVDVLQATHTGCKPVLYPDPQDACETFFHQILVEWLARNPPDVLMLAARWQEADIPLLSSTLNNSVVRAAHPVLVGPVPQFTTALPRLLIFAQIRGRPDLPFDALDRSVFDTDRALKTLAKRAGIPYISMVDAMCNKERCRLWAAPDRPVTFDYGHFTQEGSIAAVDAIAPRLFPSTPQTR